MKKHDKVVIVISIFLFLIFWSVYITKSTWIGLAVGVALFVATLLIIKISKRDNFTVKPADIEQYFAFIGEEKTLQYIFHMVSSQYSPRLIKNKILITTDKNDILIFVKFKWSALSCEDISKCIRESEQENIKHVILISNEIDRKALNLAYKSLINFEYVGTKQIAKILSQRQKISSSITIPKKKRFTLRHLVECLNRKVGLRLVYAGILIAFVSLITPFKTYYIILSTITFAIGLVCMILPRRQIGFSKNKLLK